jgi:hypothetical protein
MVQLGVPKSQAAEVVGLELGELVDGDVAYMPVSLVPVGGGSVGELEGGSVGDRPQLEETPPEAPATSAGMEEATEDERDGDVGAKAGEAPDELKASTWTAEQKAAQWKAVDSAARKWEAPFEKGAQAALEADRRALLAILHDGGKAAIRAKATMDWAAVFEAWVKYLEGAEVWRKVFVPLIKGVITDQAERWAAELGLRFDVRNFFAEDWFDAYMLKFAQPINKTTTDFLSRMLKQAMEEGWSIPDMQKRIEAAFDVWAKDTTLTEEERAWFEERLPQYRTEMIARTETMRASNAGTTELYKDWGVKEKEWLSTKDDRTRTYGENRYAKQGPTEHLADWPEGPNGQVVGIGEPFVVSGEKLEFPGDPEGSPENTINCRCTVLPVI